MARFVGNANIIEGTVTEIRDGTVSFQTVGGRCMALARGSACQTGSAYREGDPVSAAVRGEQLELRPVSNGGMGIHAVVREKSFAGGMLRISLALPDGSEVVASRHGIDSELTPGDEVLVSFTPESAVLVEKNDEPEPVSLGGGQNG